MKKAVLLILLLISCGPDLVAQVSLEPREYAVYGTVLKEIYKYNRETYANKSEFVIINVTKIDPELECHQVRVTEILSMLLLAGMWFRGLWKDAAAWPVF